MCSGSRLPGLPQIPSHPFTCQAEKPESTGTCNVMGPKALAQYVTDPKGAAGSAEQGKRSRERSHCHSDRAGPRHADARRGGTWFSEAEGRTAPTIFSTGHGPTPSGVPTSPK